MDSDKLSVRSVIVQCLATFAIASLAGLTGLVFAWPSYNVANFASNETALSEPMSSVHVSLLGSLTNVGAFIGTPLYGIAVNKLGRKYTAIMAGIPYVLSWTIISFTSSVPCVLVAMALAGFGTAGQSASSIFIAEISHDSIRGALTSSVVSVYFVGLLLSYVLGGLLTYNQAVYVLLSVSVMYIVMVSLLKESPVYLLQNGREKEAAESIAFYRQTSSSSKEVEVEIAKIKLQLDPRLEKMLEGEDDPTVAEKLMAIPEPEEHLSEWQFLRRSQSSTRALIVSLMAMAIMVLMGNIAIQVFAESLFREAVPSMDSNQGSIFLGIDLLLASLTCSLLIDRLGRKFLMIFTCIGSSICTLILGVQIQYHFAPHWVTALLIYIYNFVFNVGVAVVPFVLIAELFLPEVRGLCGSIVMSAGWGFNFITVVVFTPIVEEYGFALIFYVFTVVGFAGAAYCWMYQPETKGMSIDTIQMQFMKKSKRRASAKGYSVSRN